MTTENDYQQGISDQQGAQRAKTPARLLAIGAAGAAALGIGAVVAINAAGAGTAPATQPTRITVTSPTSGSVIAAGEVTIRGTVTPADATVTIQNQPAAVGDGVFTGTASLHGGRTTIDVIASAPDAAPASTAVVVARPAAPQHHRKAAASATTASVSAAVQTECGTGLAVGPNTSCPFAQNVRDAYQQTGPGTVTVYSPVTGGNYEMTCSYGTSVVCTGANNASVYFQAAATSSDYGPQVQETRTCGAGLEVGPHTTCPFAQNVRSAYEASGPGTIEVYSPVTRRSYAMSCSDGSSPVVCIGGEDAAVYIY